MNANTPVTISYRFILAGGVNEEITLRFERDTFRLIPEPGPVPFWAALSFQRCEHCPLSGEICPFAAGLAGFLDHFARFYSYEKAVIEVTTKQRSIVGKMAIQHGMASLIGLIGATCGCPHLAFLRPMARFHLPFAGDTETLFRAFSTHLLREFLDNAKDGRATIDMSGLRKSYDAATLVNRGMADRVRAACDRDAAVNAVIVLDTFAQAVPFVMDDDFDELKALFIA